jgi:hypothetical protein
MAVVPSSSLLIRIPFSPRSLLTCGESERLCRRPPGVDAGPSAATRRPSPLSGSGLHETTTSNRRPTGSPALCQACNKPVPKKKRRARARRLPRNRRRSGVDQNATPRRSTACQPSLSTPRRPRRRCSGRCRRSPRRRRARRPA